MFLYGFYTFHSSSSGMYFVRVCPGAAVTKARRLGGSHNRNVSSRSLEARSPRRGLGWAGSPVAIKDTRLPLSQLLGVCWYLWGSLACRRVTCLLNHAGLAYVRVSLCVHRSPFLRTPVTLVCRPLHSRMTSSLSPPAMTIFPNKVTLRGPGS